MLDRKTRITSGEEEMLRTFGLGKLIWLFVFIFLSVLVTDAWHRLEEMTTGVIKLLPSDYSLRVTISIMRIPITWFGVVYRFIPHMRVMY